MWLWKCNNGVKVRYFLFLLYLYFASFYKTNLMQFISLLAWRSNMISYKYVIITVSFESDQHSQLPGVFFALSLTVWWQASYQCYIKVSQLISSSSWVDRYRPFPFVHGSKQQSCCVYVCMKLRFFWHFINFANHELQYKRGKVVILIEVEKGYIEKD